MRNVGPLLNQPQFMNRGVVLGPSKSGLLPHISARDSPY